MMAIQVRGGAYRGVHVGEMGIVLSHECGGLNGNAVTPKGVLGDLEGEYARGDSWLL